MNSKVNIFIQLIKKCMIYTIKKSEKKAQRKNKGKYCFKEIIMNPQFLQKKKKMKYFFYFELKDKYLDKLKIHLYLNMEKRHNKTQENELIIELSSNTVDSEESIMKKVRRKI